MYLNICMCEWLFWAEAAGPWVLGAAGAATSISPSCPVQGWRDLASVAILPNLHSRVAFQTAFLKVRRFFFFLHSFIF